MELKRHYNEYIKTDKKLNKEIADYTYNEYLKIYNKKRYIDADMVRIQFLTEFCRKYIMINTKNSYMNLEAHLDIYTKKDTTKINNIVYDATLGKPTFKDFGKTAKKQLANTKDFLILYDLACNIENTIYLLMLEFKTGKNIWGDKISFYGRFEDGKPSSYGIYNLKTELLKLYYIKATFLELEKKLKFKYLVELIDYKFKNIFTYLKMNYNEIKILETIFYKGIKPEDIELNNIDRLLDKKELTEISTYIKNTFKNDNIYDNMDKFYYGLLEL